MAGSLVGDTVCMETVMISRSQLLLMPSLLLEVVCGGARSPRHHCHRCRYESHSSYFLLDHHLLFPARDLASMMMSQPTPLMLSYIVLPWTSLTNRLERVESMQVSLRTPSSGRSVGVPRWVRTTERVHHADRIGSPAVTNQIRSEIERTILETRRDVEQQTTTGINV